MISYNSKRKLRAYIKKLIILKDFNISLVTDFSNNLIPLSKVSFKCNVCNYEFKSLYRNVEAEFFKCKNCEYLEKYLKIKDLVKEKGGFLLTKEIKTQSSIVEVQCKNNHIWKTTPKKLKRLWCPYCSNQVSLTVKEVKNLLKQKNIRLLTEYKNENIIIQNNDIISYVCKECKKEYTSLLLNIKYADSCLNCRDTNRKVEYDKKLLKKGKDLAKEKNGNCLKVIRTKESLQLLWKCSCGYEWKAPYDRVKKGSWCKQCSIEKNIKNPQKTKFFYDCKSSNYSQIKDMVEKEDFSLLNPVNKNIYIRAIDYLKLKCNVCENIFNITLNNFKNGKRCRKCKTKENGFKQRKYGINTLIQIAKENKGKCLEKEYLGYDKKHYFKCKNNHIFYSTPSRLIKNNHWCPDCKGSKWEERTRKIFELIFNKPFKRKRPSWLINPKTGKRMELDGYNEELKIAFEYQGRLHYEYIPYFHKNEKSFFDIQEKDKLKKEICKKEGIFLIEVPEVNSFIKSKKLEKFILNKLKENNINYPHTFFTI